MLQRKLSIDRDFSFTDMAQLRLSQSQAASHTNNQSTSEPVSTQIQPPLAFTSLNQPQETATDTNHGNGLDSQTRNGLHTPNGLVNGIDEDKSHIANQSFSSSPITTPILPHSRAPDGKF